MYVLYFHELNTLMQWALNINIENILRTPEA